MATRIESEEASVANLEAKLVDPSVASDPIALQEAWSELEAAKKQVELLYTRWADLEARDAAARVR
jgi:hypothetical protein